VSGIGALFILMMMLSTVVGFVLAATSITRAPVTDDRVPVARVVDGHHGPPLPRRHIKVAAGRLVVGILLMVVGGVALLFIYRVATFARVFSD
jgi:hypothetical protein